MTNLDSILKSRDITLPTKVCLVKVGIFPVVIYRCEVWTIKLSTEELMLLNCGLEKTLESPLNCKEIQPVHHKGEQSWVFIGRTDVEAETPIFWPSDVKSWLTVMWRPWCCKRLRTGGEGDDRGLDGWMASLTQWPLVWVNSGSWWWTGRPGMLWFMGSQRIRHDWVTELNCNKISGLYFK